MQCLQNSTSQIADTINRGIEIECMSTRPTQVFVRDNLPTVLWHKQFGAALTYHIGAACHNGAAVLAFTTTVCTHIDRKSTRLNSSHQLISYAVFCLKKKNKKKKGTSEGDRVEVSNSDYDECRGW